MSRVAKKQISLPSGVSIAKKNCVYEVTGKLGTLTVPVFSGIDVNFLNEAVTIDYEKASGGLSSMAGLLRSLLANAVEGVNKGYKKTLLIKGLGYRAAIEGKNIVMSLGFSHKVKHSLNEGIKATLEKDTILHLEGIDKQKVCQEAATIRNYKRPDSYHAKGISYKDEVVITKEGKKK